MVEQFDSWAQTLGTWGYLVLALAALIEHVVPPFPGDTIVLLGGAYAIRGDRSVPLVFVAVTVGSMVGLSINYVIGRYLGDRLAGMPDERKLLGISVGKLRAMQESMRAKGSWLLIANRFMPTFRATLYIAAGASHMPYRRVLLLGTLSAVGWNVMLLAMGMAVGGNAERLGELVSQYRVIAAIVFGLLVLVFGLRWFLKRRGSAAGPAAS